MSDVFIPLGGAGGKNRGMAAVLGDSTPFTNAGAVMSLPLPAGNYKKSVSNPRTSYGDGKNSEVTISKELLKKMAIEAFGIASITNFSAAMYAHKQVRLTWSRPTRGLWSGVHFIFKYGSMPNGIYDGSPFWDSADVHYETTRPLQEGLWYIRAYSYVETNQGRWYNYDGTPVYTTIQVTGISGSVTFGAGAGTWTVPEGVRRIRYILVGRGGDGGYGNYYVPGGGGGGGYFTTGYMDVSPGQGLPWVVPTVKNQSTSFNGVVANAGRAPGFGGFSRGNNGHTAGGGNGGSGGSAWGGTPGTNGNDGVGAINQVNIGTRRDKDYIWLDGCTPGIGQHSPTTGFNGVLYSSGGYAGSTGGRAYGAPGTNGLGNGGNGASHQGISIGLDGGNGGTGCIYIAWGSSMNDGS
uniref:Glycine-rich domain-containing protein n=1 Tax=Siphoviridae sp. ctLnP14 TaxID=2827851 RepID=A0A8S5S8E3_9CAUD|nr:MAG TPA: hypothetical protein [Siphoviridae sp. ctLnP14]